MAFRIILILSLFLALQGHSQVLDTMFFDANWEQTSKADAHYYRYISIDTSGEFRFLVEDYFPGGQLQMCGTYKSIRPDNKDGHFIYWYEDGKKQMECYYSDNSLHGTLQEWYSSGQQESYQDFSKGVLNGDFKSWDKQGYMKLKARYNNGDKHGNFQSFYSNGQMVRDDYYENGKLQEGHCFSKDGKSIEYFPYLLMPKFPGGPSGLRSFVEKELKYPSEAKKRNIEGAVLILFTVGENGSVKDPRVVNGDHEYFNREAIRVVERFPGWIPGEVDGIPSPIQVSVPIEFRLR